MRRPRVSPRRARARITCGAPAGSVSMQDLEARASRSVCQERGAIILVGLWSPRRPAYCARDSPRAATKEQVMRTGSIVLLVVLVALLAAAGWYAYEGLTTGGG